MLRVKLQSSIGYFGYSDLFKLFDTMTKPIILYGSELWGFEISDTIENVQDNFCNGFLKLNPNKFLVTFVC